MSKVDLLVATLISPTNNIETEVTALENGMIRAVALSRDLQSPNKVAIDHVHTWTGTSEEWIAAFRRVMNGDEQ